MTLINGTEISNKIRADLKKQVNELRYKPHLSVVLVGDDPASAVYVKRKTEACKEVGIASDVNTFGSNVTTAELEKSIRELNYCPWVDGILVQLPLPKEVDRAAIFDTISPQKDVDVFNPANVGLLMQGRPRFIPCTPQGISLMLAHSGVSVAGKHVVVINRSDIVGKPLWCVLINDQEFGNATVTVCHDHTPPERLKAICLTADIIVVAVGIPGFLKADMVQPHQVVIDVGITRVGKFLIGDVAPEVADKVAFVSPVPGGVGPLTIASLLINTVRASKLIRKSS